MSRWQWILVLAISLGFASARRADAIVLTNGSLSVDIRADNGAIDTVSFGGTDFFNPGTPVSDWGLQVGTDTSSFRRNSTEGVTGIPVVVTGLPGSVEVSGTFTAGGANVTFVRTYELVAGQNALRVTSSFTNAGAALDLAVFDTFDPDQGVPLGLGYSTYNDLLTPRLAFASATNDYTFAVGTASAGSVLAAGSPFQIDSGALLEAFLTAPVDGEGALADQGLHVGARFPLGVGGVATFDHVEAFGLTRFAALAAVCAGTGAADSDGDGICDVGDVCPADPDPLQADADADGVGDACDNCPAAVNPGQGDADGDLDGDACDLCTDGDGDGAGDPGFPVNSCPVDNCPATANPGQRDLDADSVGDACDADDAVLTVTRLRWKPRTGTGNPNGSIAVQGDFVTDSSAPTLDAFSTAAGVELTVTDGLGSSVTTAPRLLPADCATKPSGVVKCKSADKTVTATFKPVSTASTSKPWIFRLGVKKLSVSGLLVGPVSVTLRSSGDVDRADTIGACGLSPSGILSCRRY